MCVRAPALPTCKGRDGAPLGGVLRTGAFGTAGTTFLQRLLAAFGQEHPDIHIDVENVDRPADALETMRTGRPEITFILPRAAR